MCECVCALLRAPVVTVETAFGGQKRIKEKQKIQCSVGVKIEKTRTLHIFSLSLARSLSCIVKKCV